MSESADNLFAGETAPVRVREPLLTTLQIEARLRERYAGDAWALFFEVGNATGSNCTRHLDAVAMSLWPSRGLELVGMEIKASRADWKKELDNPAKADPFLTHLHRFYVVAGAKNIVASGELPLAWGLIVPRGEKLVVAREAPLRQPIPPTFAFLAALLRAAQKASPAEAFLRQQVDKAREETRMQVRELQAWERKRAETERDALKQTLADFESRSGIKLNQWQAGNIGDAVAAVLRAGNPEVMRTLRLTYERLETVAKELRQMEAALGSAASLEAEA